MSSRMTPAYFRAYRVRRRLEGRPLRRRAGYIRPPRGDRSAEYAKRRRPPQPVLEVLMPELQHGTRVAFWEDELRLDLAQERSLALVEGRDPVAAVNAYRQREVAWRHHTAPLLEERAA